MSSSGTGGCKYLTDGEGGGVFWWYSLNVTLGNGNDRLAYGQAPARCKRKMTESLISPPSSYFRQCRQVHERGHSWISAFNTRSSCWSSTGRSIVCQRAVCANKRCAKCALLVLDSNFIDCLEGSILHLCSNH